MWSYFGIGYGFVPLALPIVGMFWLRYTRPGGPHATAVAESRPSSDAASTGA